MRSIKHLNVKGKWIYDSAYDILTFKVRERNYKISIEMQNFVVDIDEEGYATGVRIFDASKIFGVDKYVLRSLVYSEFKAIIENNVITVTLKFVSKVRNKIIPLFKETQNFTQQFTAPISSQHRLADSVVECAA
ncbi:DUF2283 domain-containing protein [Candidatus Woesearchaeota archaeon]|nr:DUF2283 domain-containing protein [Candidatus Woesearchaeota archaeon]